MDSLVPDSRFQGRDSVTTICGGFGAGSSETKRTVSEATVLEVELASFASASSRPPTVQDDPPNTVVPVPTGGDAGVHPLASTPDLTVSPAEAGCRLPW